MDYSFYFDESSHNFRITDKTIFGNEDYSDSYVGIFLGIPKESIVLQGPYGVIELCNKSEFMTKGELKGTKIKNIKSNTPIKYFSGKETFKNGVASFDESVTKFYSDFFSLFTDEVVIHICIISKFEQNLISLIDVSKLKKNIEIIYGGNLKESESIKLVEAFLYSFTKFFYTYRKLDIFEKIYSNDVSKLEKVGILNKLFDRVLETSVGVKRKEKEIEVIPRLKLMLNNDIIRDRMDNKFNHEKVLNGFKNFLKEKKISPKEIDMYPDNDSGIDFQTVSFKYFREVNSKDTIEVRIADVFSSFVNRFIFAIKSTTEEKWGTKEALENFHELKILPSEWFELNEDQFSIYSKISMILIKRKNLTFFANFGLYLDDGIWFFSVMMYFNSYNNYEEYLNFSSNEHKKKCHKFIMNYLNKGYKKRDW